MKPLPIHPQQKRQLLEQGFTTWDAFIDAPTVDTLRQYYDRILSKELVVPGDRLLGSKIRQVMAPSSVIDYFTDNPALDRAKSVAREIFQQEQVWFFLICSSQKSRAISMKRRGIKIIPTRRCR